jgi:Tol biopolymer transport system component
MTEARLAESRQVRRRFDGRFQLAPFALALLLSLLACALGPPGATPLPPQSVATAVAATLTAIGPGIAELPSLTPETVQDTATMTPSAAAQHRPSVAFVQAGQLWLASPGTGPRQLTTSGGVEMVRISSDGRRIIFTYRPKPDDPAELRALNADGTNETILLTPAQMDSLEPPAGFVTHNEPSQMIFIPGSHALLLNLRGVAQGPGLLKYDDLWRLDADGGSLTPIFPAGQGGDITISPDGTTMTISRPESIGMSSIDGSRLRSDLITFPIITTYSEYSFRPHVGWNPDSQAAGVVIPSPDPLAAAPTGEVWVIARDGGLASRLAMIPGQFFFFGQGSPSLLSPDLSRVAFVRQTPTANQSELLIANADGSDEMGYGTGSYRWLGWSPDSRHFAFISTLASGPMIMVGSIGEAPAPVAPGQSLTWISESGFISLQGSSTSWSLMLGDLDGRNELLASDGGEFPAYDIAP